MQLNQLKPIHKRKKRRRVGRGDTYAGLGRKGQTTRAGRKMKPAIREFVKRYPKLRGYRFKSRKAPVEIINLRILEKKFKEGETVSPFSLLEKGLIAKFKGKIPQVKILGRGELNKKLHFKDCILSKSVQQKVKKVVSDEKAASLSVTGASSKRKKKAVKPRSGTKKKPAGRKAPKKKASKRNKAAK